MKRFISVLALAAVLAFSATTAFAADTGVNSDVTAHIMGQDLPLYSISIMSGSTLNYNVVPVEDFNMGMATVVDVVKKGETAGSSEHLIVSNDGTEDVSLRIASADRPSIYDAFGDRTSTGFDLVQPGMRNADTQGVWEFSPWDGTTAPSYVAVEASGMGSAGTGFGLLASGHTKAFSSRLTLPNTMPADAPSLYRWTGYVLATAVE